MASIIKLYAGLNSNDPACPADHNRDCLLDLLRNGLDYGCTIYDTTGLFLGQIEPSIVVEVIAGRDSTLNALSQLEGIASAYLRSAKQEEVMISFSNEYGQKVVHDAGVLRIEKQP